MTATGLSARTDADSGRNLGLLYRQRRGGTGFMLCLGLFWPLHAFAQLPSWTRLNVTAQPTARYSSAMVYDANRGVTVLFGGNAGFTAFGDTWDWDGVVWTQNAFGGPSPRFLHAMAFDSARGVTVLFGGFNGENNGETWEYGTDGWVQSEVDGPSPRALHAMAYDSARRVTVLFGGSPEFVANGETWEWDGIAWTQRSVAGPPPRGYHAMAYDAARGVTVLFGGLDDSSSVLGDTWEWSGAAWARRGVSGPSARAYHAMAYDSDRRLTVLFGGTNSDGGSNAETWEWNGALWFRAASGGPSRRSLHRMAYDPDRRATVLFGGNAPPAIGDTWELRAGCLAPFIASGPASQNGCLGSPSVLSVSAGGTGPFAYQWRRGTPSVAIPQATSNTYTIAAATAEDAGAYDCHITNACGSVTSLPATLSICIGDFNCDGGVDGQDVESFFLTWVSGESAGDINADGGVDGGDVEFFFVRWEAGC